MRLVFPPVLALVLALFAGQTSARPPVSALEATAALPPEALIQRLRAGHARVNEALSARKAVHMKWQSAVKARDEAAAQVERSKRAGERGTELEEALRRALVLDEAANVARSSLLAKEAEVARRGAELLSVYDALLVEVRRQIEGLPIADPRRAREVRAYQALASQRDQVRQALSPVLAPEVDAELGLGADVRPLPDDDIETLLEKADLARDLEERFLRRAALVRRRIAELEEESALARDVKDLVRSQSLFDEEQRRLVVMSPTARARPETVGLVGAPVAARDSTRNEGAAPAPAEAPSDTRGEEPQNTGAPSAPPADSASSGGGRAEDSGGEPGAATDGDFGSPPPGGPLTGDDSRGPANDVRGALVPQVTEQPFVGDTRGLDVDALLASGRLTLPELRLLEKKLREEAERMRREGKVIRTQVREQAKVR